MLASRSSASMRVACGFRFGRAFAGLRLAANPAYVSGVDVQARRRFLFVTVLWCCLGVFQNETGEVFQLFFVFVEGAVGAGVFQVGDQVCGLFGVFEHHRDEQFVLFLPRRVVVVAALNEDWERRFADVVERGEFVGQAGLGVEAAFFADGEVGDHVAAEREQAGQAININAPFFQPAFVHRNQSSQIAAG